MTFVMKHHCFVFYIGEVYTGMGHGDGRGGKKIFVYFNSFVILKYVSVKVNKRIFPVVKYNICNYEL